MSAAETVEVPVDRLRYLCDLAEFALDVESGVETHLVRVAAHGTSLPQEDAQTRRDASSACNLTKALRDELARLVPEEE